MATAISIAEAQDAVGGAVRRWGIEGRVLGSQVPARGRLCNAHGVRAGVSGGPTLCGQVHMPG